ncbi:plant intracellular Ras-group-related LRR protein 6-like isoform X1 [Arachis ipaensis]|uniref:plant intracellular Ras-group-related LRR protein 6-like isoform X1 n=1 Tax=Arachis ipaensis TaxID=130454 RepID=UPI000A2B1D4A|nr:plant intracellular Ras-group-related LRR protein 6-like isoform X1 [Arachis ipaensis]
MRSSPSRGTKMRFEPCLRATVASSSSCQRRKVISSMTLNRASSLSSMLAEVCELDLIFNFHKGSNNLIASLPEDLANCSKLSKLNMEGNKLTEISENLFSSWTMLTEFNASKNLLNGIPDSIGGLSRLIRLDLHQNNADSSMPPNDGLSRTGVQEVFRMDH